MIGARFLWQLCVLSFTVCLCLAEKGQGHKTCPPLRGGSNCTCFRRQQGFCKGNESFLHIDYRLFLVGDDQLMGHSIFELPQSHNISNQALDLVYQKLVPDINKLNDQMCDPIHRDTREFCSRCVHGYGPSPYTYYGVPCTKCSHQTFNWLKYLVLELSFPTIIFFFFVLFRARITSGFMIGFVFYCQVIANTFTSPYFNYLLQRQYPHFTKTILTLYGFWNMDFFRLVVPRFCVSENLSTLGVVTLGYISAFYPLVLTLAVYTLMKLHQKGYRPVVIVWKPFHWYAVSFKRRFISGDVSLVDTFATFLLLSYSKILLVSLQLLRPMRFYVVVMGDKWIKKPLSYSVDPSVRYWKEQHIAYGTLALVIFLTFLFIPSLVLCLHPTRCGRRFLSRWSLTASKDFNRLVNAFQLGFKNGQDGSSDYRMVAAIYVVHRITLFFTNIFLQSHDFITYEPFLMQAALYVSTFAFFSYAQPYKKLSHTCVELLLLTLLTAQSLSCFKLYGACPYQGPEVVRCKRELERIVTAQCVVLCVPQFLFLAYVLWLAGKTLLVIGGQVKEQWTRSRYPPLLEYSSLDD